MFNSLPTHTYHRSHFSHRQADHTHAEADSQHKPDETCSAAIVQVECRGDQGKFPCETKHNNVAYNTKESEATLKCRQFGTKAAASQPTFSSCRFPRRFMSRLSFAGS